MSLLDRWGGWPPGRRAAAGLLALVAASSVFWGCVLLGGMRTRAFDISDPSEQMRQAAAAADAFRSRGAVAWAAELRGDYLGKPALDGVLSLGILLGLPADHIGYKCLTAVFVILLMALLQCTVWRAFGPVPALLCTALFCGSGVVLGQAYYGGHSWLGQDFLWAALLAATAGGWRETASSGRRSFLFGSALCLSVLASYHMSVWAAAASLFWAFHYVRACRASRRLLTGPLWGLAAGAVSWVAVLELGSFAVPAKHYWQMLWRNIAYATDLDWACRSVHGYFFSLLGASEPAPVLWPAAALAVFGAWELGRRALAGDEDAAFFLGYGLLMYGVLEIPGVLRLGRIYLPLLPFLFIAAGVGCARLLERLDDPRARAAAAAAAALLLFVAGRGERRRIDEAFYAGREIAKLTPGRAGPLLVAGWSLPYIYIPGQEIRLKTLSDLRAKAPSGDEWVLISRYSRWFWHGFMGPEMSDIPVEKVYASQEPFVAVPGVESSPFEPFTNDAFYCKRARGEFPFPESNRLYRARDFFKACGS